MYPGLVAASVRRTAVACVRMRGVRQFMKISQFAIEILKVKLAFKLTLEGRPQSLMIRMLIGRLPESPESPP